MKIFDIENEQDIVDFWDLIPDEINDIYKNVSGEAVYFIKTPSTPSEIAAPIGLISINWHDKTEIHRPCGRLDTEFTKGRWKMNIKGKVHCMFEQSGTFKNEFIKLGIPAEDYDIQNNFGQTDHVIDLFAEIEKAYGGGMSIFDNITPDDLIIAFFPCIYFCATSQIAFSLGNKNYIKLTDEEKIKKILERSNMRKLFYDTLIKFVGICFKKNLRMIFENPWNLQTYLRANFLKAPDLVDNNRALRGDYFKKPTAYWYFNCEPTYGESLQPNDNPINVLQTKASKQAGICSEERSMISSDYARNFICDFILGKPQNIGQLRLF